jgi:hypothetical protein
VNMTAAVAVQRCPEESDGPPGDHTVGIEVGWT